LATRPTLMWSDRLTDYNLGPSHPLAPIRVALAIQLARELGVLDRFDIVEPRALTVDELATVHARFYIAGVQELSEFPYESDPALGLGTGDNPVFHGMHDASALVAGASVEAARRVWTGEARRAANIAGGLHHAMPDRASGFCVYNDPALAIRWMLDHGAERVAYVDVDAHHGDGVQAIFYDDPRVLTVSIHEGPRTLFPGTGYPEEVGGRGAEGTAVNIALPPGTTDAGWLRAFHAVVPAVVEAFAPEVLVSQHGCDSHADDPLTNLALSIDGQRASYLAVERLAEEHAGGKWVVSGGGGYALFSVVPRVWTHLLAIVAGRPLEPLTATPPAWRDEVSRVSGVAAESAMTDGESGEFPVWTAENSADNPIDGSIRATRAAIFPLHNLDPNG
jgi:acetoin utilization protein AcuC